MSEAGYSAAVRGGSRDDEFDSLRLRPLLDFKLCKGKDANKWRKIEYSRISGHGISDIVREPLA